MIREAHDYRVGLFDRYCRKLTGRSYSAMPNAVVRDFPPDTMRPGDVFLMNDTYLTEGSIGHLPDLCSTVPVFHGGEVVAYIQAFGHHDDIGGRVPGSMPGTAVTVFEEGLAIPPVKLYAEGVRNEAVFTIVKRNTRVPDMLAADLDSEVQACLMGAQRMAGLFERFGRAQVEACFQAILDECTNIFRDELLPRIADGEYRWEDYVEHDGVTDPKLHKIALTMTKAGGRITLDFTGTDPQSTGPINWPADCRRRLPHQWIAPILRNLADTPARAAETSQRGSGSICSRVCPRHADHAGMLARPMHACSCRCAALGLLAGVVQAVDFADAGGPGDHPPQSASSAPTPRRRSLPREVLGGGSGGRYYADGNDAIHRAGFRNQPAEFTETRFPCWWRSPPCARILGGAARGAGGPVTRSTYWSIAAPSSPPTARLGCCGLNGGKAASPRRHRRSRRRGREPAASPTASPCSGAKSCVVTTGGGGWGDPLSASRRSCSPM
jgi:N-methylhydantoinase B